MRTKAGARTRNLNIRISADELDILRAAAEREGVSMSDLVRMWVRGTTCGPDEPKETHAVVKKKRRYRGDFWADSVEVGKWGLTKVIKRHWLGVRNEPELPVEVKVEANAPVILHDGKVVEVRATCCRQTWAVRRPTNPDGRGGFDATCMCGKVTVEVRTKDIDQENDR